MFEGWGQVSTITENYLYDSTGKIESAPVPFSQALNFTAREWDQDEGLYFYRARYYDPEIGRFMTEDPLRFKAGTNFYVYASNNWTNLSDPTGLYELKGFSADQAAQMSVALGQLAAKLKANPCCVDPKLRDRIIDLLQPFQTGGVTFVYKKSLPMYRGQPVCAEVAPDKLGWLFNKVYVSDLALSGQCGCLPSTLLHETIHLTWKNRFGGGDMEAQPNDAEKRCFGSCAR